MSPDLSNRQFAKNLSANLLGFAVAIVSGFFVTPFLVGRLGVAAYGLVPLTNNVVGFLAVITVVLSSSVSRFITLEVARRRFGDANRVFNTSLWASGVLALLTLAVGGAVSFRAESLVTVPVGYESESRLMFALATTTFALNLVQIPFGAALFCANRVDLNAWLSAATRLLQVIVGAGLVATVYCRPGAMMIAALIGTIVSAAANVHYWRRLMPWSRIAWGLDRRVLREQVSFGLWNGINLVGALLYMQIDLLVINRLLGAVQSGQYAALSQWPVLLRGLGGTVSAVFAPTVLHYYARNDVAAQVKYTRWSIRTLGLFLALPVGAIAGLAGPLLACWLGADFSRFGPLLAMMVIHLGVNVAVYPLFAVQSAVNKVKVPAIVTCIMGGANALLAVSLTPVLGMYGVAVAGALTLTAKNVVFTPVYAAQVLGCRSHVFFGDIAKVLGLSVGVAALGYGAARLWNLASWPHLIVGCAALGALYIAVVWTVMVTPDERAQLRIRVLRPAISWASRRR